MDVVSYKCPNCSAGLGFDIESQDWHCKFCGSHFGADDLKGQEPQAPSEQAQAAQEQAPDAAPENAEPQLEQLHEHFGDDARAFTCPSCGGQIITDHNTAATFCLYCHNPTVLAARLEDAYRPVKMIPFKLKKDEVHEQLRKYCKKRPLLPRDFREWAERGEIGGLYVPYWLFTTDIDTSLAGMGQRVTTWSDSNYRYRKTDTYRIERRGTLKFQNMPADGSKRMDDDLMEALEPFNYGEMVEFSMQYLSGHFAENYDVDAPQAAQRAFPRMYQSVTSLIRGEVRGYNTYQVQELRSVPRNTHNDYVMLPVWTLMAPYNGKTYTFAMNGQTGKIAGSLPLSMKRALAWFGAVAGAVTAVAFVLGGFVL